MITTHTKISEHRASSRLWVESHRLSQLGFEPGQRLAVDTLSDRLRITPDDTGPYTVSYKRANGIQRPVLDINSDDSLRPLVGFEEATLRGSHRQLIVKPSVRATHIRKAQLFSGDVRVLDLFAGAGSLSFAASSVEGVSIVGGVEHDPSFADIWCKRHTGAELILSDISRVRPEDLPDADLWQIGLPCTSHSTQGRAKKKLAGRPEDGDSGWLFAPTLSLIAARMPTAVLIENVPAFQGSLAHSTITSTLKALGYHVSETVLEPHAEWGDHRPTALGVDRQPEGAVRDRVTGHRVFVQAERVPRPGRRRPGQARLRPDPQHDHRVASQGRGPLGARQWLAGCIR